MNIKKYIKRNKKRSLLIILGITLSSVLLMSIGILFSSFREYLINNVKNEIGSYHVIIKGNAKYESFIEIIDYKEERYFITYKNIYNVYKNTEKICSKIKCENITYNNSLLTLYGLTKDNNVLKTIKKVMYFIIISLSIILFFIIYNSFKVSLNSRRKELCLLKLNGYTNKDIYKLFIKESLIMGIIGITLGFIISVLINYILINILNNKLFEIFGGNIHLKIYTSFIIVPIIAQLLIIILSSIIPLKNVKKFRPMELFRINNEYQNIKIPKIKNFIIWLSVMNYTRHKEKYKSLIICIFITCLSSSVFSFFLKYGLKCVNDFIIIPKYDLKIEINDEYDMKKIAEDLDSNKKIIYNSCEVKGKIKKENYIKDYKEDEDILITNLGNNEIVNLINKIENENTITHLKYKKLKKIDEVIIENEKITNLKLTNIIPFGFDEIKNIVINLDNEQFEKICPTYKSNLILKTDYQGIDKYINELIKSKELNMTYINVKKARQITENLIKTIKIILYAVSFMVMLITLISSVSICSLNTMYRKRELFSLKSIGLNSYKITLSFIIESAIISFKGWFYALPFILIINKYIYISVNTLFNFGKIIIGLDIIIIHLIISFLITSISVILCYKSFKKNIINNIKIEM